jgi:hypothetical protein
MNDIALQIIRGLRLGIELNSNLPYDDGSKYWRSPKKPHMKDLMFGKGANLGIMPLGDGGYYFEIGNEEAEEKAPQYHILEDAKVIRRPNRGTKISKGSQANILDKAKRDYGGYIVRGGTQKTTRGKIETTQEYRQNMSRNFFGQAEKARDQMERMKYHYVNNRNWRPNHHWQYIERILTQVVPQLASEVGATLKIGKVPDTLADMGESTTVLRNAVGRGLGYGFLDPMTGEVIGDDEYYGG